MASQSTISDVMDLNNALVQEVLAVAEGIISENRVLNAKLLYNEAKRQVRGEPKVLLAIITFLMEHRILVEGSKLTKELVLSNLHRKNIYEFIRTNRGAKFSTIRDMYEGTTGSSGQLIWHLQLLLKFNYIKRLKFKRFTIFLPVEMDEEEGLVNFFVRDPLNHKILKLLCAQGPLKRTDLYEVFDAPREKIHYRVKVLLETNLITAFGEGEKDVRINPEKLTFLTDILKKSNDSGGKGQDVTELEP
jgi:predicted transcriptional regulator